MGLQERCLSQKNSYLFFSETIIFIMRTKIIFDRFTVNSKLRPDEIKNRLLEKSSENYQMYGPIKKQYCGWIDGDVFELKRVYKRKSKGQVYNTTRDIGLRGTITGAYNGSIVEMEAGFSLSSYAWLLFGVPILITTLIKIQDFSLRTRLGTMVMALLGFIILSNVIEVLYFYREISFTKKFMNKLLENEITI